MALEPRPKSPKLNQTQMAIFVERIDEWNATVQKARAVLRDDMAGTERWTQAVVTLNSACEISIEVGREKAPSPEFLEDMLVALTRGSTAAKIAIGALYRSSGRPSPAGMKNNRRDPKEWREYLVTSGFLGES
jgi:hypothetical protein